MIKKMLLVGLGVLSLTLSAWAQDNGLSPTDTDFIIESTESKTDRVEMTPDLVELLVEIDPKAHGFRARNHTFQMILDADPLINGRLTLGFQYKLNSFLTLDVPVSFEHNVLGQWLGRTAGIFNPNINSQWSIAAGAGLKIRLSEWMMKSSFYLEPMLQIGYYTQTVSVPASLNTQSIRIRPGLYLGWQQIFDTGFVIGAKLGVEKPFDIAIGNPLSYSTNFSVVPMIGAGYAW